MKRRVRFRISGRVQGVGFRPAVFRLAVSHGLAGFVRNSPAGVVIEAEGGADAIERFTRELRDRSPVQAAIDTFEREEQPARGEKDFVVVPSERSGDLLAGLPPDLATCDDCLAELLDPNDRRHRYPFINCTNCGPRFTVARELPYDRERTSMAGFQMCPDCAREFQDAGDRRFEAQLDACAKCGPQLSLIRADGAPAAGDAVQNAAELLRAGAILAVKGVGGYHLCCDAAREEPISTLRQRKNRPHKALAVMFKSVEQVEEHCRLDAAERQCLCSGARPIVVLKRKPGCRLPALISPDTDDIGAFLPYAPLHHLLLREISPLVMTSGNLADEPIVRDESELDRILGPVADHALTHNRPIVRRCDDSVLKVVEGRALFIRRSRGYVPDGIPLRAGNGTDGASGDARPAVLGCGADIKNTFCVSRGPLGFVSQHIGDLIDYRTQEFFHDALGDLCRLLGVAPGVVAHDLHPDYVSTRYAVRSGIAKKVAVQHHHAHIAACMVENGLDGRVIGVALDGLGMGDDGTLWGGEFLVADRRTYRRAIHFRPYRMPGGDQATEHPERMAYSCLLTELNGDEERIARLLPGLDVDMRRTLRRMLERGVQSPLTSSAGRLFDVAAAMLDLCRTISYEAQAAIRLERLAADCDLSGGYEFALAGDTLDFGPTIRDLARDIEGGRERAEMAAMFHNTVALGAAAACEAIRGREGLDRVALSGGCFQNERLLTRLKGELGKKGFEVHTHRILPPNDACISLGQVAVGREREEEV